ncbi:hypothetical protein NQ315_005405 [Exocentrus adspersus]|uniref:RNase H type-1 domain-containing protein n=1 Tax=Exocentrus adspersus TaxID=1586481 RepID=A0AAV8W1P0_9CUCU|nr:hypothetical protein NQ315_005405 [Exocentrus adspersus]
MLSRAARWARTVTVFQEEVFAILMVAQRDDVKNFTEKRIFICSDSQAALRAISTPRTTTMLVQECLGNCTILTLSLSHGSCFPKFKNLAMIGSLESLARQKEVGLVWVPGHMGIPGKEG